MGLVRGEGLEIITPIRGRKLILSDLCPLVLTFEFRNNNPDKGTETGDGGKGGDIIFEVFRNNNPDKGTETDIYYLY